MTEANLATALAAFQKALPKIGKGSVADAGTYKFKYADLADVSAAVLPLLGEHGLSFSARPTLDEGGRFVLAYELLHASDERRTGSYPLPASGSPQQIGSAITYARRYALCAVTGVAADEDDDGQAAKETKVQPERHEHSWDPNEQKELRDNYEAELRAAKNDQELGEVAARIRAATKPRAENRISSNTSEYLLKVWAERKAELNGGEQSASADRGQPPPVQEVQ